MKIFPWVLSLLVFQSAFAQNSTFLIGANALDWECNPTRCAYGKDIGHNGWNDLHLSMHGYTGTSLFRKSYWIRMMDDLAKVGANFIRIPTMTEGQGILWKPWINGRADQIQGADPQWMETIVLLLDEAHQRGLKVQIGALTGNTFRNEQGMYNFYYGKNQILQNPETRLDYLSKVIHPLLRKISQHPALEHFEIMGETDGALSTSNGLITTHDLREFISTNTAFIRTHFPSMKAKLSASIGFGPTPTKAIELFRNTGLDLIQVHLYNQDGTVGDCNEWSKVGMPILLGEFGLLQPAPATQQADAFKRFVQGAKACGFIGASMWTMDYGYNTGDPTRYNNFYTAEGTVKPEIQEAFRLFHSLLSNH